MNEPIILAQITNQVTPSLSSIYDAILITNTETTLNEDDDSCARKDDNVSCSNSDFDLHVNDASDFMDDAVAEVSPTAPDEQLEMSMLDAQKCLSGYEENTNTHIDRLRFLSKMVNSRVMDSKTIGQINLLECQQKK